jgi:hypothetical protein
MGLSSPASPSPQTKTLLDEYLQLLAARRDEEPIADLYGALSLLRDAPRSATRQDLFTNAIIAFHKTINIPEQGMTGGRPNAELRCIACLGMAVAYIGLNGKPEVIAEKIVAAIYVDPATASYWVGNDAVRQLLTAYPPGRPPMIAGRPSIRSIIPPQQVQIVSQGSQTYNDVVKAIGNKQTVERYFSYNYSDVVMSIVFALQRLSKPIVALNDAPYGSFINAKQPMSFFNNPGSFLFQIIDEGPSRIKVVGTLSIGQLIDWGKSKQALNQIYSEAESYLVGKKR